MTKRVSHSRGTMVPDMEYRTEESTRCQNQDRNPVPMSSLPKNRLDDSCSDCPARVAATLVALHVAAHAEGLSAARVGAAEGFLARVAVGVDAQRGRPRERFVAGSADVAVLVLLVGR